MSTTTATFGTATSATSSPAAKSKGLGFFQRLIAARERQGQARVRAVFARMTDAQLRDIGFNADQVREIRVSGKVPATFWA